MSAPPTPADPRPIVIDDVVLGSRCPSCGHASVRRGGRCERCLDEVVDATFGPRGTVWSATTVHIRVGDRRPPFALAYVDLDGGPRVLAHVDGPDTPPVGSTVRVTGAPDGDVVVQRVEAGS
ncbi:MAG: OB-fold domain-containing protein [Actinomycetota bacterium]